MFLQEKDRMFSFFELTDMVLISNLHWGGLLANKVDW